MTSQLKYTPPEIKFDDGLAGQLARQAPPQPFTAGDATADGDGRINPFVDYARVLTPEGGILIVYRDCARGGVYALCRVAAWTILTAIELRFLADSSLSFGDATLWFLILAAATLFLVTRKIKIRHTIEIRHDRMILDGKHVFWAQHIGRNWPQLQKVDQDDPNRMVIAGTYGTRHVIYSTANRIGTNDRTPEVLAADLQDAMQQLWGRTELDFG
jgi:hypothetical protein